MNSHMRPYVTADLHIDEGQQLRTIEAHRISTGSIVLRVSNVSIFVQPDLWERFVVAMKIALANVQEPIPRGATARELVAAGDDAGAVEAVGEEVQR